MADAVTRAEAAAVQRSSFVAGGLLACILLCLALQAWLALVMEINWDEFYFLSHVYEYQRGELTKALQTFHVHLFGWLPAINGDEIRQVEAGRLVMLLCEAATCAFIYMLARAFFDRGPALLAVLSYVAAGFTMIHGASFRPDPLAGMLIMAGLTILARARPGRASLLAVAAVCSVAALVTVKVIFYLPAFAGIAVWRYNGGADRVGMGRWLVGMAIVTGAFFGALYLLHLAALPQASHGGSGAMMNSAARTTLLDAGFAPRLNEIIRAFQFAPVQAVLSVAAILAMAVHFASRPTERNSLLPILACAAPLLTLLFYRNAFPYFFPFITPPAALLVAWIVQQSPSLRGGVAPVAIAAAITLPAIAIAAAWGQRDQAAQQQVVAAVHRIFPEPVVMIDGNSMVSSFPKRGYFMTSWGLLGYRRSGPIFGRVLEREPVPLIIANSPAIEHALGQPARSPAYLFPEDQQLLRRNFVPHWGPIWVAGQTHRLGPEGIRIRIAVPGIYTVEGAAVEIDGRQVAEGGTRVLVRGSHRLRASTPTTVTLRWGDNLYRPEALPPSAPLYRGFE